MITIASLIVFLSFYTLYYTSKRAVLSYDLGFEKWMQKNPKQTKIIGLFLLLTAYSIWLFMQSLGCGTLMFLIQLMTIGSLIIILTPLKKVSSKILLFIFVIIALLELYYY
jgi:tryptophan-rich sensory protein